MRVPAPALLPILRSPLQGEVLAAAYLSPEREFSVTELAQLAGATPKATGQEVERLVANGFLADRRRGNMRLIRRPESGPLVGPLTDLLAATFGPLPVLVEELGSVTGIVQAFIYGSWAARHQGTVGRLPVDVDVIVIGQPTASDLDEVALRAQRRLRREVNIRTVSVEQWSESNEGDVFLRAVRARPLVEIPVSATGEQP